MIDDMGIFRTTVEIASLSAPDNRRTLMDVMVDTDSEYNWIPSAILIDLGPSDLVLLGAYRPEWPHN